MRKLDLDDGCYFNETDFADHKRVVILGYSAAKKVFQGAPGAGQHIEIGGLDFEVIGTMRNKIQDSMYQGPDNENAFIPFAPMRDLKNLRDPDEIIIQPIAPEQKSNFGPRHTRNYSLGRCAPFSMLFSVHWRWSC